MIPNLDDQNMQEIEGLNNVIMQDIMYETSFINQIMHDHGFIFYTMSRLIIHYWI